MGITKSNKWLCLFFLLLFAFVGHTQVIKKEPLRTILDRLEQQYAVSFTYMDKTIDSLRVSAPESNLSLSETLSYLEEKGDLQFLFIDDEYISVRARIAKSDLCGYLLDSENGDPILEALVYAGENLTTTDQNGFFKLSDTHHSETVFVSHVSYEKTILNFDPYAVDCPDFLISRSTNTLDEVMIRNYITRGINKKVSGEIEVDVQNTNILPGLTEPDVFFALQNLPGIQSINETVTDINIRGGSNDQNLVLWDGVRLYQTGHFFGLVSAINPYIIEKSSVIKNGTSANWGEGVSGTIQVETSDKRQEKLIAEIGSNLINSDQFLQIPLKKTSLTIASRQSLSGLIVTPTYKQYFDRAFRNSEVINNQGSSGVVNSDEQFGFYDLSVNAFHEFSKATSVKAGLLTIDNSINYQENAVVNNMPISRESNLDQGSLSGYLSFNHLWTDRFKTQLFGSLSDYKQQSMNFDVLTNQEHLLENEVLETNLKLIGSFYANDNWYLTSGIQLRETGIRNFRDINIPEFRRLSKEVIRTTSFFVENTLSPFKSTDLVLGLRTSYFDKIDRFRIEPRLSAHVKLGGPFSMTLLGESKSQTTVQVVDFQTDFLGVENRKWELINGEDIPLLTSNQFSLGLNYQKESILLSLEGYHKRVDGIVTSSQGFLNQFQYIRSGGNYTASGLELLINPSFGQLDSWLTYTLLSSDYLFPELIPPRFRNNFDISHTLSSGFSLHLKNLEVSSGINYRSGLPFTGQSGVDQNDEMIIFNDPNNLTLAPYFRLDFSTKYSFKITDKLKGKCGLAIWNLTDQDNIINAYYQLQNGDPDRVSQLALGITPNVNFRVIYTP